MRPNPDAYSKVRAGLIEPSTRQGEHSTANHRLWFVQIVTEYTCETITAFDANGDNVSARTDQFARYGIFCGLRLLSSTLGFTDSLTVEECRVVFVRVT